MSTKTKVKVSERALFARVSRKLAQDGIALRRCRENSRWLNELGYFYEVDIRHNSIVGRHVNLEEYAKELGLLKPYETAAG